MKPISNKENIKNLKTDDRLIECYRGDVNYYRFLCIHPHNENYVILMNFCEIPVRFYYQDLINRFFTDYTERDIFNYRKDYYLKTVKEIDQALSELKNKNNLED